ncbi:MAG: NAD(P)-binding domain-containing protein [Bacteroidetes bacterium]|nr:NAD(P)-binding domain-containing protein [Bacteroidota bacterium]
MNIAVLGTGMVGDMIASKLISLGHKVMMGSRTANNEKALAWCAKSGANASQGTFGDAAQFATIVFNCTKGMNTLDALNLAGSANLKGKILIDISNPLDFSKGMPPVLSIVNDNSLGEEIQKLFPETKVVKTLNTLNCQLMVNPALLNNGDHNIFVSGNSAEAKSEVVNLLHTFGWIKENIIDLGDITTARGTEQLLPVWVRLYGAFGSPMFQFKIVK